MINDAFYNTVNVAAKDLSIAEHNALTQEQRILRWFIQRGLHNSCGPTAVREFVFDRRVPLTSVRRAMTSLTIRGDLIKLQGMIMGTYGKPEHLWTVAAKWDATKPHQRELL